MFIGFAIGTAVLLNVNQDFATSNAKIVGGMVTGVDYNRASI